ncbi:Hypothetical protein HDN1F_36190 [gamma proteobacterium HdN1]|nr:Hypothetical protein HDN1F_36190 [gamma proteobacterium HdN1]
MIYKSEKSLFAILAVISLLVWIPSFIFLLPYLILLGLIYLFAQSAFISWIRGTAVAVGPGQYPELHAAYEECGRKLGMNKLPAFYIMNAEGFLNALATRFLRRHYVVVYSAVLDALQDHPESIKFYIGHELAHVKCNHLGWSALFVLPATFLPLIGPAYRRAQEYTCDLHGAACCIDEASLQHAIGVLAVGATRWKTLNRDAYLEQAGDTGGFWMSFHELTASYPWLVKRMQHALAAFRGEHVRFPSRHPLAWFLAAFIPNGAGGATGSILVLAVIVGILAAVALPAYLQYTQTVDALNRAGFGGDAYYQNDNTDEKDADRVYDYDEDPAYEYDDQGATEEGATEGAAAEEKPNFEDYEAILRDAVEATSN